MQIGKKRKHIMFIRICLPIVTAGSCILNDKEQKVVKYNAPC